MWFHTSMCVSLVNFACVNIHVYMCDAHMYDNLSIRVHVIPQKYVCAFTTYCVPLLHIACLCTWINMCTCDWHMYDCVSGQIFARLCTCTYIYICVCVCVNFCAPMYVYLRPTLLVWLSHKHILDICIKIISWICCICAIENMLFIYIHTYTASSRDLPSSHSHTFIHPTHMHTYISLTYIHPTHIHTHTFTGIFQGYPLLPLSTAFPPHAPRHVKKFFFICRVARAFCSITRHFWRWNWYRRKK
jgi:hypothetical protein